MKLFYYCFAGTHSSVIAAAIHLKKLPADRVPTNEEIMNTYPFDLRDSSECGIPFLMGVDEKGCEVYVIGLGKDRALGLQVVHYLLEGRKDREDWKFFNTLPCINILTRCGGFLSREWRWVSMGRYLVIQGIRSCYRDICKLVHKTKEWNDCPEK